MGTDYAEKEREFVASLAADTGRDLSAWMAAISAAGLAHRNDIIDWLRQSGFTFANASWLERIHHNGGKLVYGDDHPPPERAAVSANRVASPATPSAVPPKLALAVITPPPNAASAAIAPSSMTGVSSNTLTLDAAASDVLLAAKGLRPLAVLALQEIMKVIPATRLQADGTLLVLAAPKLYLALLPGAKALRFYGDFDRTSDSRATRSEAAMKTASKAPPPFPSVLVLSDARLVDDTFAELVKAAHARVHG